MITTGSQGEPMSALSRIAMDDHKQISIEPGDTVILSSRFIPGNERTISTLINHLYRRGAEVYHEKVSEVHVSGHASQEELKLMLNLVRPRFFIPVHGEYRHLVKHTQLAGKVGIPRERCVLAENGDVVAFDGERCAITGSVETVNGSSGWLAPKKSVSPGVNTPVLCGPVARAALQSHTRRKRKSEDRKPGYECL